MKCGILGSTLVLALTVLPVIIKSVHDQSRFCSISRCDFQMECLSGFSKNAFFSNFVICLCMLYR